MKTHKHIIALVMVGASLVLGLMIYLGNRPEYLTVNQWFHFLPLDFTREIFISSYWCIYSLPDALWIFALTLSILLLWNFRWSRECTFWFLLALVLGISFEAAQAAHIVQGTFDPIDLTSIIVAGLLPISFTLQFKRHAKSA